MSEQILNKVALCVVAHADDTEFGIAGTVASWVRDGWDVYYVICTDCSGGGPDDAVDLSPAARQRTVETRKLEQRAAAKILGVKDVIFLDYPDGLLQPTLELRRDIVRLIRQYRPSRLVCQSPERSWTPTMSIPRYHPDHLAAGEAALAAAYPAAQNPWDFPELFKEGLKPHKVSEVYITATPVQNHYVDITETMDIKLEALRAHESQVGHNLEFLERMLRDGASALGEPYGYSYAEAFHLTRNG